MRAARLGRWLLVAACAYALFWVGTNSEVLFPVLTDFWQRVFGALGLAGWLARLQSGTSQQVTLRSLPAVVSYSLGYLALCLLIVRLLLREPASWYWAWRTYLALGAMCAVLEVLARLTDAALLYRAGRDLIDFLVSPLPVLALLALLTPAVRRQLLGR